MTNGKVNCFPSYKLRIELGVKILNTLLLPPSPFVVVVVVLFVGLAG